jgi:thioredoxin-related protein
MRTGQIVVMHNMRNCIFSLIFLLPIIAQAGDKVDGFTRVSLPNYSKNYDPERDPFEDGNSVLQNAKETQRRVIIEVGGDWCSWCHILEEFITNTPIVYEQLHDNFVVLKVNFSDANENQPFLDGLPKITAYPHLFITENDGSVIYSGNINQLLENGNYSKKRFSLFLDEWSL